jgi:hypothetical protein
MAAANVTRTTGAVFDFFVLVFMERSSFFRQCDCGGVRTLRKAAIESVSFDIDRSRDTERVE